VAEEKAKEAKREKWWQDFKETVTALAMERGAEIEMERARREFGFAMDKYGGEMSIKVTETQQENGDTKIVVFTKYLPLLVKNPEHGTKTETIINRASLLSKVKDCK